jgi:hypothetical protein
MHDACFCGNQCVVKTHQSHSRPAHFTAQKRVIDCCTCIPGMDQGIFCCKKTCFVRFRQWAFLGYRNNHAYVICKRASMTFRYRARS